MIQLFVWLAWTILHFSKGLGCCFEVLIAPPVLIWMVAGTKNLPKIAFLVFSLIHRARCSFHCTPLARKTYSHYSTTLKRYMWPCSWTAEWHMESRWWLGTRWKRLVSMSHDTEMDNSFASGDYFLTPPYGLFGMLNTSPPNQYFSNWILLFTHYTYICWQSLYTFSKTPVNSSNC